MSPVLLNPFLALAPAIAAGFISNSSGSSTTSVSKPSGAAIGDHLLVCCIDTTSTMTSSSGLTSLGDYTISSGNYLHVFAREIDGSEGSTFTVSNTTAYYAGIWRGGAAGLPAIVGGVQYPSSLTNPVSRGRAPVDGTLVHIFATAQGGSPTIAAPSSPVNDRGASPTISFFNVRVADELVAAGDDVSRTATVSASGAAMSLAFMFPTATLIPTVVATAVNSANGANANIVIPSNAQVGDLFIMGFQVTNASFGNGPPNCTPLDGPGSNPGGTYTNNYWFGMKRIKSGDAGSTLTCGTGSQVWGAVGVLLRNASLVSVGTPTHAAATTGTPPAPTAPSAGQVAVTSILASAVGPSGNTAVIDVATIKGLIWRRLQQVAVGYGVTALAVHSVPSGSAALAPTITTASSPSWEADTALFHNPSGYEKAVLDDNPVGYWRLSEPSGTKVIDFSGNGCNGTYVGSPTLGATGLVSGDTDAAVSFVNSSAMAANIVDIAALQPTVFTVEVIAKPSQVGVQGWLMNKTDINFGYSATWGWAVIQDASGTLSAILVTVTDTTGFTITSASSVFTAGVKTHVALTYDGTTAILYANGVQVASGALSGALKPASGKNLFIGSANQGGSPGASAGNRYAGTLDEAAMYATALSSTRIAAHAALV